MFGSIFHRGFLIAAFLTALAGAAHAEIRSVAGVPDEFQKLAEPHIAVVNLYYGGYLLGPFAAHVTPESLRFDKPEAVLDKIPSVSDKIKLLEALRHPLPANADLRCTAKRTENCGKLTSKLVDVIYDDDRQAAELFVAKDLLDVTASDQDRYLPLPERIFSSTENITGALTGTSTTDPQYTLTNHNIYSVGEIKLTTDSTLSNQGLREDSALVDVARNGWNAGGGLFRSRAMQLIPDEDIAGFKASTSMQTVNETQKTEGNPVIVYLPRRSFVSIYREGRLYSAHDYEAGNQKLDTSELPEGAYNITIKIQDPDGSVTEETRFFAKNDQLPPVDHPVYYAQAGLIRKPASSGSALPQITAHPLGRLGTAQRLTDDFGGSASLLVVQDRSALEVGDFWLIHGTELQSTLMYSTKGDAGVMLNVTHVDDKFSVSADLRETWLGNKAAPGYADLFSSTTQATMTLGYAVTNKITFGARGSFAKQSDNDMTSFGPFANWRMWESGESSLGLTADFARTSGKNAGNLMMQFSYRFGAYGVSGAGGDQYGPGSRGAAGNVRGWYNDETPGDSFMASAGVNADSKIRTYSADSAWNNHIGQFRGGIQQSSGAGGSTFGYGGNLAIGAAELGEDIYVGGNQNDSSAVVVETDGDSDAVMKIYVDGMEKGSVRIGERQTMFLVPFHTYNIRLIPQKNSLLDYENGDRRVTLYPGNVVKLKWSVNKFYVVSAHLVGANGRPLQNAVLQEARTQTVTDDKGRLQAELSSPATLTFMQNDGLTCRANLPKDVKPVNGVLLYKKPLTCTELADAPVR